MRQEETTFLDRAYKLYQGYNEKQLRYQEGETYNKLVTADPFHITPEQYEILVKKGYDLRKWLDEQQLMFDEIKSSRSLRWFKELLYKNHSQTTLKYQFAINSKQKTQTKVMRVDLSSFPFSCHEAQLRWGAVGHIHSIPLVFNDIVPFVSEDKQKLQVSMLDTFKKIIDEACQQQDECAIYLTPNKYIYETLNFTEGISNLVVMLVSDFNEQNFEFTGEDLIHKNTHRKVRIVFRRELTLETLSRTDFGRKVVNLYLLDGLTFEPDLNLINDAKLGMAFAFDKRTRQFFSDSSRDLFLKTCLFDDELESFNGVFNKEYTDFSSYIENTSQTERNLVYKYGGYDLQMSFGSSHVYRLDRTRNKALEIINMTKHLKSGEWILQEFDGTRFPARYAIGDFTNRDSLQIKISPNTAARFMLFYQANKSGTYEPILGLANLVTDHWKARFKTSDLKTGMGSIVTPIRVQL